MKISHIKKPEKYGKRLIEDTEFLYRKMNKLSYLLPKEQQIQVEDALETILNASKDIGFIILHKDKSREENENE